MSDGLQFIPLQVVRSLVILACRAEASLATKEGPFVTAAQFNFIAALSKLTREQQAELVAVYRLGQPHRRSTVEAELVKVKEAMGEGSLKNLPLLLALRTPDLCQALDAGVRKITARMKRAMPEPSSN